MYTGWKRTRNVEEYDPLLFQYILNWIVVFCTQRKGGREKGKQMGWLGWGGDGVGVGEGEHRNMSICVYFSFCIHIIDF